MDDNKVQKKLQKTRAQNELQREIRMKQFLMFVCCVFMLTTLVGFWGWKVSNDRYANNVRVAWVKIGPSGDTEVQYLDDGGSRDRYFDRSLDQSLIDYVKNRFGKSSTIQRDYAAAFFYLSNPEASKFLNEFNASEVAAAHVECESCGQIDIEVRAIDHDLLIARTQSKPPVYRSTIYMTEITRKATGAILNQVPRLVILKWTLKPVEKLGKSIAELENNPIGVEILTQEVRDEIVVSGGSTQ